MAQEINMERAYEVYSSIVKHLDKMGWTYDRHDDDLVINTGVKGDDMPIEFIIVVNAKNQVVQFISKLPFNMEEDKRVEGAIAISVANYGLVDGSFDYAISDGEIRYRVTCSYRGSDLSGDLIDYIIAVGVMTVEDYNEKFFMLSKGLIDVKQFIELDRGSSEG